MGTYAESLLTPDERVLRRERQHPIALILDSWLAIILWSITIILILARVLLPEDVAGRDVFGDDTLVRDAGHGGHAHHAAGGHRRAGLALVVVADAGVPRHQPAAGAVLGCPQQDDLGQLAREDQRRPAGDQRARPRPRLRPPRGAHRGAHRKAPTTQSAQPRQGLQEDDDDRQARPAVPRAATARTTGRRRRPRLLLR